MYQFRDPIHGFIDVSDDELKIIDSAPFQRLRHIHQLATTYLVYHGAEHTRFGHSIGVMHLTSRTFDAVTSKTSDLFSKDKDENEIKTKWYRQILRIIGLVHDLGHAPFSHASEELFVEGREHEDYTRDIILKTDISERIADIGKNFSRKYGESFIITPELVWMVYSGEDIVGSNYNVSELLFLKSFMDGELDCDKMDYLLRDSLYCGVSYGRYDIDRFISTLMAYKHDDGEGIQLAVERGGVQALEEFILARYFMFIQVYFHKTRRILDKMLVNALMEILPDGKYPMETFEYLKWDDNKVLELIADSSEDKQNAIDFRERNVMTCIYESKPHAGKSDKISVKLIFDKLRSKYGENVFRDGADKFAHKLTPIISAVDDEKGIIIYDKKTDIISNLMDESIILKSLDQPISIKRIYASKNIANDAIKDIQEMLSED